MKKLKFLFLVFAFFNLQIGYSNNPDDELKILVKRFYKLLEKNEYVQDELPAVFSGDLLGETDESFFLYQLKNGGKISEKEYEKMYKDGILYKLFYQSLYDRRYRLGFTDSFASIEKVINTPNRFILTKLKGGYVGELIFGKRFIITFVFIQNRDKTYRIESVCLTDGCSIFRTPDDCQPELIKIGTVAENKESINLYQSNHKDAPVIKQILRGMQIKVEATYADDFYKVVSKELSGYIRREDFRMIKFHNLLEF